MLNDRAHARTGPARRAALRAVLGILDRLLRGGFSHSHALHADRKPGIVHHREHAGEALVFFPNKPADSAFFISKLAVTIDHGAGWRAMDTELVFN